MGQWRGRSPPAREAERRQGDGAGGDPRRNVHRAQEQLQRQLPCQAGGEERGAQGKADEDPAFAGAGRIPVNHGAAAVG